jgi:hypothetical protein
MPYTAELTEGKDGIARGHARYTIIIETLPVRDTDRVGSPDRNAILSTASPERTGQPKIAHGYFSARSCFRPRRHSIDHDRLATSSER